MSNHFLFSPNQEATPVNFKIPKRKQLKVFGFLVKSWFGEAHLDWFLYLILIIDLTFV